MKKMKLLLGLLLLSLIACAQDQTFEKIIIAKKGIQFGDGTQLLTAPTGTGSVTWDAITGKPLTFPPSTHDHNALYKPIGYVPSWAEITSKPTAFTPTSHTHTSAEVTGTVELVTAIRELGYLPLGGKTTTEINAIIPPANTGGIAFDITLNVYKAWKNNKWIIIPLTDN